jgi:hypothetical protein
MVTAICGINLGFSLGEGGGGKLTRYRHYYRLIRKHIRACLGYSRPSHIRTSHIRLSKHLLNNIHSFFAVHQMEFSTSSIENVLFHISEHFTYPNKGWSRHVRICEGPLYHYSWSHPSTSSCARKAIVNASNVSTRYLMEGAEFVSSFPATLYAHNRLTFHCARLSRRQQEF